MGVANASTVTSRRSGITHLSRYDRLLYTSFLVPAAIAADPALPRCHTYRTRAPVSGIRVAGICLGVR